MLSTRLPAAWRRLSSSVTLARWPALCAVCQGWGAGRVCAECGTRFSVVVPRCRRCALPVAAGVDYGLPWDPGMATFMARRVARRSGLRVESGLPLCIRDTPHRLDLPPDPRAEAE